MPEAELDAEQLVKLLRELAERLGTNSVSRRVWLRETGITERRVLNHFDSWNGLVRAAGLTPDDRSRLSDDELFGAMHDAFVEAGGISTRAKFRRLCRYGDSVYTKRWGTWTNILASFRIWAEHADPAFPHLDELPVEQPTGAGAPDGVRNAVADRQGEVQAWTSTQRTQYGPFVNFRGLQHAPINEQGVVFLFGMVAFDLGYVVEGVGTGFPDCEAKRRVSKTGDVWERVRIEFEFKSRNFLTHGHDPAACDVIVCWQHNWPECPLEVLDLQSEIEQLDDDA